MAISKKEKKIKSNNQRLTINDKRLNIDVPYTANLANLKLSKSEEKLFPKQLKEIIGYVSKLEEIDTSKVEPIGHITGLESITRADIPAPSLSQEDALKNAPKTYNGFIEVEAIFEEQEDF